MTLKSVQEKSADGQTVKEPHKFSYYGGALPHYISTSIDHFGGFNNKGNGNNLIPQIKLPGASTALNSGAADRSPVESAAKRATIDTIFYPTGGYSKYHWEINRVAGLGAGVYYDYDPTQNGADDRDASGLRVQSVESYDCDNTLLTKRSYRYVKSGTNPANQSSSGRMLNEPNYTETTTYKNCFIPLIGGGSCNTDYNECARITISASSRSTLGTIKNSVVGYSRIEEIIEANDGSNETAGKVVYFFKNEPLNQFGAKDDVENGLLIRKEVYNALNTLLDKSIYIWSTDEGESRKDQLHSAFRVIPEPIQDNKPVLCQDINGYYDWRREGDDMDCVAQHTFPTKFKRQSTQHIQKWVYQSERINTRYFFDGVGNPTGSVTVTTDYVYGDTMTNQPTETIINNSDGKTYKTVTHFLNSYDDMEYPVVDDSGLFLHSMLVKGMTGFPLVQAQYIDNQLVYKTKLNYKQFSTKTLPYKLYETFPT